MGLAARSPSTVFFISENVSSINVLANSPRCRSWCKSNDHPNQPAKRQCSHTEHFQCQVVALFYLPGVSCYETRGVDVYQRAGQGDLDRGDLEQWLRFMDYSKRGYQYNSFTCRETGDDLERPDVQGLTMLMWASAYGQTPTVQVGCCQCDST